MRTRNLKPGFFKNEDLAELPFGARILFEGLWCFSDREGRFEWRPKKIKAEIFPYDNVKIEALLKTLLEKKFILHYSVDGVQYGYIPTFLEHQHPFFHEAKSIIPPPNTKNIQENQCLDMAVPGSSHGSAMALPCLAPYRLITKDLKDTKDLITKDLKEKDNKEKEIYKEKENILSSKPDLIPFFEIISYLNQKTKKHFSHKTKAYRGHIKARWNEGKRLDDFKRVVDVKFEKWGTDQKMIDYLRPETLFGTKMDSYLNEGGPILETSTDKLIYEMKKEREERDEHS